MRHFFRRILASLVLIILVLAGAGFFWLRTSLPVTEGRLTLPGLTAEIRVTRDAYGIPTIVAQNEHDADFALGFLHAQDRLFAMDGMRRYGAGRLSEWFGPRTLGLDRSMRVLGIYRAAEQQYEILSPEVRGALDAYAAGVNAFLATRKGALPPEYYLIGATPEPWKPADSLVWGKLMDIQLTGNYRGELLHARLAERLSPADLLVLYPGYPKDAPVTLAAAQSLYRGLDLAAISAALPPGIGPQRASNNWVVDGAHSVSGKPLLANDPHLDFGAPGVWYLARIETPQEKLAGVTAPGTPFLVIGHNETSAWGFTTTGSDVEDLFVEKPDPADPGRYLTPDGSAPFLTREEKITVRGADPVSLTVRETRHGPVISDLPGSAPDRILALSATWLAPDDRTPDAVWKMTRTHDWEHFRQALTDWVAPQQNIVYADTSGTIGFIAPARIPIRGKGDGWMPSPGWTGEYDWTGTVPFDALPAGHDPASGRFVSANNKIVPDDYPYFLTRDWELPYRAARINALLDKTPQESSDGMAAIQSDMMSLPALQLLPLTLHAPPGNERRQQALALLRGWSGEMDRDRTEPLIFIAWLREFSRGVLADKLGADLDYYWNLRPDVMRGILTGHPDWCDPKTRSCDAALAASLDRALDDLAQRYGSDMKDWRWGNAHLASFASALWSNVPLLGRYLALDIPVGGDDYTVDAGAMQITDPAAPFLDRHGPSMRMIVDLAAPEAARFMVTPGQSGNPLSGHWGDLLRRWRDVRSVTFGNDASGGTLVMAPP